MDKNEATIKMLLSKLGLHSMWWKQRIIAVHTMGELEDRQVVELLISALHDRDQRVADEAVCALGKLGDERAFAPLLGILKDKNSQIRHRAIGALGQIDGGRAIIPLLEMADEGLSYHSYIGYVLNEQGVPAFFPMLSALKASGEVANFSTPPIYDVAAPSFSEMMTSMMNPTSETHDYRATSTILPSADGAYEFIVCADHYGFVIADSRAEAGWIDEQLGFDDRLHYQTDSLPIVTASYGSKVQVVVKLFNTQPNTDFTHWQHAISLSLDVHSRQLCVDNGGEVAGEPQCINVPADRYKGWLLYGDLDSAAEDSDWQSDEHYCLMLWPSVEPTEPRVIKRWDGEDANCDAGQDLFTHLALLHEGDSGMRIHAARVLGKLAHEEALTSLVKAADDPNSRVRCAVASALGSFGTLAINTVLKLLRDQDENVRLRAAQSLGKAGSSIVIEPLLEMATTDSGLENKDVAIAALGELGDTGTEALIKLLKSKDMKIREQAAYAIGRMGVAQAITAMTILLREGDEATRYMAAWTLGQIGDARALPALEQAAKSDVGVTHWGDRVKSAAEKAIEKIRAGSSGEKRG